MIPSLPPVCGGASSLHLNACPAAAAAACTASSPAGPSAAPADRIHFSIRDTGIGISPAQAANLFECFKQGSEAMSRRYGGTGLGLAISRRLTELMHGEVCSVYFVRNLLSH